MTSRREFLGASAAGVLSLPFRAATRDGEDQADSERDGDERPPLPPTDQPEGYPRETEHGGFSGSMDVPEFDDEMGIRVSTHPNQAEMNIDVSVTFHGIEMGPAIGPDDARELAETLLEAADDVKAWQEENITPEQREAYW